MRTRHGNEPRSAQRPAAARSLGTRLPEDEHVVGDDFSATGDETASIGKAHFHQLESTKQYESLEAHPRLQVLEFWRKSPERFYGFDHGELAWNHTDEAHVGQHDAIWLEGNGFEAWRDCSR